MTWLEEVRTRVEAGPDSAIERLRDSATLPVGEPCAEHGEYHVYYGPGERIDSYCPKCRTRAEHLAPVVAQQWANDLVKDIPRLLDLVDQAAKLLQSAAVANTWHGYSAWRKEIER